MKKKYLAHVLFMTLVPFIFATDLIAGDLILTGALNGNYSTDYNIVTSGACTVEAASDVSLSSGFNITLKPGFRVKLGGIFSAEISDADGLPNWWEMDNFSSLEYGLDDDPDEDYIDNYWEYTLGLGGNSYDLDSDSDGLPDWYEVTEYQSLDHDEQSGECDCD